MNSETNEWPPQEAKQTRQADELFLEMALHCDCLRDEHLRILSTLADTFLAQVQAAFALLKTGKQEPRMIDSND